MKKRLISFVLVAVSVFSLVGNCFAMESVDAGEISGGTSSIEPQNNRYYTVREIDPAMHREQTVTVSKAEAAIKDKAKSIIGAIIGGGSGNLVAGYLISELITGILHCEPYDVWGTYYLSIDYEKTYRVDRLDATHRYLESTDMITTAALYQDGVYKGSATHRLNLK